MNVSPTVYCKSNDLQRRDSKYFYDNYSHLIELRKDGSDTILDIGSGTGDVTNDFLLPIVPNNFKYLVGADIAQNMVDFANKSYSSPKISFVEWNMAGDSMELLKKYPKGFNHIFSTFAMHWELDHQHIFRNIYDLLTPNGDCLLAILARHNLADIYLELSKLPKWTTFFDTDININPIYQYRDDRVELCMGYLRKAAFKKYSVELLNREYIFDNIQDTKKFLAGVNPFLYKMSTTQKDDFFRETFDIIFKLGLGQ